MISAMPTANPNIYKVPSASKADLIYIVDLKDGSCNCPDHRHRQRKCKHIKAAEATKKPRYEVHEHFHTPEVILATDDLDAAWNSYDEKPGRWVWDTVTNWQLLPSPRLEEQDAVTSLLNEAKGLSEFDLCQLIAALIDEADRKKEEAALLAARDAWEAIEAMLDDSAVIDDSSFFAEVMGG